MSTDFEKALATAFNAAGDYQAAHDKATELTQEVAQAVAKTLPSVTVSSEWEGSSLFVIATSTEGDQRTLWRVRLGDSGYSAELWGPELGEVVQCETCDDLQKAFVKALSAGIVGIKLKVLAT